ncbi:MAG TPA: ROK family protein [Solirubrobacteraceae bacterium]|jgi:glucokinase
MHAGIDLGGTKVQVVVVDDDHEVHGQARHPTPTEGGPEDVVAEVAACVREAAEQAGVETGELQGIGMGSPGAVDDRAGTVTSARNLPGWAGTFNVREVLERELGAPLALGNDVQVAVDAEFELGAAKPYSSLLGVFWGTGVGGGIVLDGKPWVGRRAAGEIGHVCVKIGGARCGCGREGCMEAYAGRAMLEARARRRHEKGEKTRLFKIMEERNRPRLTSGVWNRALGAGDKLAQELIDEAVEALGAGVASALNVLDVEAVVIGGGLGLKLGEPYVEKIRAAIMPHLFTSDDPPAIMLAALGDLGGAQGAALLASRHVRA